MDLPFTTVGLSCSWILPTLPFRAAGGKCVFLIELWGCTHGHPWEVWPGSELVVAQRAANLSRQHACELLPNGGLQPDATSCQQECQDTAPA